MSIKTLEILKEELPKRNLQIAIDAIQNRIILQNPEVGYSFLIDLIKADDLMKDITLWDASGKRMNKLYPLETKVAPKEQPKERDTIISEDDIMNLKIILSTCNSVEDFINQS